MAQLTWRAVLMGSLLRAVLSLTNLYIGLKAGWGMGVAITACILSYSIWTGFVQDWPGRHADDHLGKQLHAIYRQFGGLLDRRHAGVGIRRLHDAQSHQSIAHSADAGLGVLPRRARRDNGDSHEAADDQRRATPLSQRHCRRGNAAPLHSHGDKAARAAYGLGIAGILAAASQFWSEGLGSSIPSLERFQISTLLDKLNNYCLGKHWMGRTVSFPWDPVFMAAGALTGLRVSASMMLGGTLCWAVFVPILEHNGILVNPEYRDAVKWTVWGGVSCMVTSGLLSFVMQWRSALRAFSNLGSMFWAGERKPSEVDAIEAPMSWFIYGQLFSLVGLGILAYMTFHMLWWQSTLAVLLSFLLALVAARVTGETDTTPVGAMGKVTQLFFGAISPGNMNINLMSANITAGAATSSADLLTDLKSGYLLAPTRASNFLPNSPASLPAQW